MPCQGFTAHGLAPEERTQNVRGLDFAVLVPGVPGIDFDALEASPRANDATHAGRGPLHLDAHTGDVSAGEAAGNAVVVPVVAECAARVAPVIHPGRSDRGVPSVGLCASQGADRRLQVPARPLRQLDPQGNMLGEADGSLRTSPNGTGDRLHLECGRTGRMMGHGGWHLVTNDVDHTAECVASEEDGSRPPDHLDPSRRRRVHGSGVVDATVEDIPDSLSVLEHENPVSAETADDRVGRARAHTDDGQPRFGGQRLRNGRRETPLQLFGRIDAGRPERLVRRPRGDRTRDDEAGQSECGNLHLQRNGFLRQSVQLDRLGCVPEPFDSQVVAGRGGHRNVEGAVSMRDGHPARADDRHRGSRERCTGLNVANGPLNLARVFELGGRIRGANGRADGHERCDECAASHHT